VKRDHVDKAARQDSAKQPGKGADSRQLKHAMLSAKKIIAEGRCKVCDSHETASKQHVVKDTVENSVVIQAFAHRHRVPINKKTEKRQAQQLTNGEFEQKVNASDNAEIKSVKDSNEEHCYAEREHGFIVLCHGTRTRIDFVEQRIGVADSL
jgi:hypothetical protein